MIQRYATKAAGFAPVVSGDAWDDDAEPALAPDAFACAIDVILTRTHDGRGGAGGLVSREDADEMLNEIVGCAAPGGDGSDDERSCSRCAGSSGAIGRGGRPAASAA